MGGMPPRASRILIVDDHPLFRSAAREVLTARGYSVVGEADCARNTYEAVARLAPDGVLLDVCLGAESGLDVAHTLTRARPTLAVLLVSVDPVDASARRLRECGARAFLLKSDLAATDLSGVWG